MRPGLKTAAAAAVVAQFALYRHWHLHWGATHDEVTAAMPGDGLVQNAQFRATRAITIEAPPSDVWPWLVQVGFSRAGFYSYDVLDNLARPSAKQIIEQFQPVTVGDVAAPMATPVTDETSFRVHEVQPERCLVWAKPGTSWAWTLTPLAGGRTRLVTRLAVHYDLRHPATTWVPMLLMELGDFPMMRKMLLGLRERAEAFDGRKAEPAPPA